MRHKWEIEKEDFRNSFLNELRQENCSPEDEKLAQKVISYLTMFLPLNYNPGRKLEIVPTLAGLSLYTGIPKEELEQKEKENKVFKKLYAYLYAIQEARVLALSLKNKINYKIASLVLFNHGYRTKKTKEETSIPPDSSVELTINFTGAEYTPLLKINPEIVKKKLGRPPKETKKINDLLEQEIAQIKEANYESAK